MRLPNVAGSDLNVGGGCLGREAIAYTSGRNCGHDRLHPVRGWTQSGCRWTMRPMDNRGPGLLQDRSHCRDVCSGCQRVNGGSGWRERNMEAHRDPVHCMVEGAIVGCKGAREAERGYEEEGIDICLPEEDLSWSQRCKGMGRRRDG